MNEGRLRLQTHANTVRVMKVFNGYMLGISESTEVRQANPFGDFCCFIW